VAYALPDEMKTRPWITLKVTDNQNCRLF